MAIIPAHSMRSIGGGYDNESVAMTTMLMTFYFWIRSLRSEKSWPIGIIAGLAYIYMVATWGGYIFVINMVGVHAGLLLGMSLMLLGISLMFLSISTLQITHCINKISVFKII
jgi:dolichyl-diphosphooligosaccharide--protein glycosyltransferase